MSKFDYYNLGDIFLFINNTLSLLRKKSFINECKRSRLLRRQKLLKLILFFLGRYIQFFSYDLQDCIKAAESDLKL